MARLPSPEEAAKRRLKARQEQLKRRAEKEAQQRGMLETLIDGLVNVREKTDMIPELPVQDILEAQGTLQALVKGQPTPVTDEQLQKVLSTTLQAIYDLQSRVVSELQNLPTPTVQAPSMGPETFEKLMGQLLRLDTVVTQGNLDMQAELKNIDIPTLNGPVRVRIVSRDQYRDIMEVDFTPLQS